LRKSILEIKTPVRPLLIDHSEGYPVTFSAAFDVPGWALSRNGMDDKHNLQFDSRQLGHVIRTCKTGRSSCGLSRGRGLPFSGTDREGIE